MNNTAWKWIWGIIIIILVLLGIWWYAAGVPATPAGSAQTTTTTQATSSTPVAVQSLPSSSVAAVVASLTDGSSFNSYFVSSGVAASLGGKGPYTVFVPTNQSIASLPPGTISALSSAALKRLVQFHVVSGKALDLDAVSNGTYTALSKDTLNFHVDLVYKEAFVNSAYAITEYKASNGIVYLISSVLVPPQIGSSTTGSTGTPHP